MVSKWWMAGQSGRQRHQSKIYAESREAIFLRIFRDLTSIQILAFIDGC
jgi:hypothetical protein